MKLKTPIYFLFACGVCLFVAVANWNGWSLLQTMTAGAIGPSNPATRHK